MTDYDVIVIGCGPAGMTSCGELAKKGFKVLGIDKKPLLDTKHSDGFRLLFSGSAI